MTICLGVRVIDGLKKAERRVGIGNLHSRGINALYKQSPEDFIVEEIAENGDINSVRGLESCGSRVKAGQHFTEITLVKRGLTTPQAITAMAGLLGIDRRAISYAGLKDRKAVTAQAIRVPSVLLPSDPASFNAPNIKLLDPRPAQGRMRIGELWGNRFSIRLLPLSSTSNGEIRELQDHFMTAWIPNFFYLQRFGRRQNLHLVGACVARGDFRTAAYRFLFEESALEPRWLRRIRNEARSKWPAQGVAQVFEAAGRSAFDQELQLLRHLSRPSLLDEELPESLAFCLRAWVGWGFNLLLSQLGTEAPNSLPLFDGTPETKELYSRAPVFGPMVNYVPENPRVCLAKGYRECRIKVKDIAFQVEADDSIRASFCLPKGAYATTALRSCFHLHTDISEANCHLRGR